MNAFRAACWRWTFRAKGLWNCGASVAFLLFDDSLRDRLGVPRPDSLYRALFLALAFVFGLGYWWVGRDLDKNLDIVRMGILGQFSVFGLTLYAVTLARPSLPWPFLLPGLVDLVFAIAFVGFLWVSPRRL
jgi:hypothetical protein